MPVAHLEDRAILTISGPDAENFLQNLITTDLSILKDHEILPGALLSPQGKILFDFLISRTGDGAFRLECRAEVLEDFTRRLMLYRLRAKVEIASARTPVAVIWASDGKALDGRSGLADGRFAGTALRHYDPPLPDADTTPEEWNGYRIAHGIAESGADYALGDAFPHDVLLDKTGGLSFGKGCYVGQEVVSRMQHRGTARRRIMIVDSTTFDDLPPAGTALTAGGKPIGSLGQPARDSALSIVRTDKVAEALAAGHTILAGDVPVTLEFPEGMGLSLPIDPQAAGNA